MPAFACRLKWNTINRKRRRRGFVTADDGGPERTLNDDRPTLWTTVGGLLPADDILPLHFRRESGTKLIIWGDSADVASCAFLGQINEIHFYPNPKHIHSQRPISTYSLNMNFVCTWISFRLYEKSHRRGTNAKCGIIKWRVLYTTDVYENLRRQQHGPIITWTNHNNYTELTVLILSWSKTLIYDLTTRL